CCILATVCLTSSVHSFFFMRRPPPIPTLFPYTTLFRSAGPGQDPGPRVQLRSWPQGCGCPDGHGRQDRGEVPPDDEGDLPASGGDRKSTRLNSSHVKISYAVFCLKKKIKTTISRDDANL